MLGQRVQQAVQTALHEANRRRHEFATLEHLCLALLHDGHVVQALQEHDVDVKRICRQLTTFLSTQVESVPADREFETLPSTGVQRVLQRAAINVLGAGRKTVESANVLVSIFAESDSYAVHVLREAGLNQLDVAAFIEQGQSEAQTKGQGGGFSPAAMPDSLPGASGQEGPLTRYAVDLIKLARDGKLDACIGREQELDRAVHVLARRTKNNPLFVGEAGVGKTALIHGLARSIAEDKVPTSLRGAHMYALDMAAILAGSRYRGDFEGRLRGLLKVLEEKPHCILVLDEMHTLMGAGATTGSSMDASSLLKPALTARSIRFIGATTYRDYASHLEKDQALLRRFQKVDVKEPASDVCVSMLRGLRPRYEKFHNVRIPSAALQWTVDLATRYLSGRHMPDSAIDLLDETAAALKLARDGDAKRGKILRKQDLATTVARMAQVPCQEVGADDRKGLQRLGRRLKHVVFGQDAAVDKLASTVKLARAGLRGPDKPMGCFLFTGPTGCGKTELAKQLAHCLGIAFMRFDMSEYMEPHSVSRLLGAPPGYVGFDQGGLLTDAVAKTPHGVVLLDEVEKAHPDIFNTLLQVMDHGRLTSAGGRVVDFRHVALIMTSNVGARELTQSAIGFGATMDTEADAKAFKRVFSPEFRNRLDARVAFACLTPEVMSKIVEKFLAELTGQLAEKNVRLLVTPAAKQLLGRRGYDQAMGARPLARLLEQEIKKPLADELLYGKLKRGGQARVDVSRENGDAFVVKT
ncbi:MAG: AAA family ATPase [Myxococcota bacterium]